MNGSYFSDFQVRSLSVLVSLASLLNTCVCLISSTFQWYLVGERLVFQTSLLVTWASGVPGQPWLHMAILGGGGHVAPENKLSISHWQSLHYNLSHCSQSTSYTCDPIISGSACNLIGGISPYCPCFIICYSAVTISLFHLNLYF